MSSAGFLLAPVLLRCRCNQRGTSQLADSLDLHLMASCAATPTAKSRSWVCYCLISKHGRRTYVGATVSLERRLRQHNGEISGGARATSASACKPWQVAMVVDGFGTDKRSALSFEKRWKLATRRMMRASSRSGGSKASSPHAEKVATVAVPFVERRRARAAESVIKSSCWHERGLRLSLNWNTLLGGGDASPLQSTAAANA